jgi:RNA polymerase sigma-70 factor (ECF subfamily)
MDRRALRAAAADPAQLATLIDDVASDAASGSSDALDTLLWAIDKLSLGRGVVQRLVLNEPDVEDVTQDVLIAVAEKITSFRGDARFTTWLHQVARFKAIAHLRRKRDEAYLDDDVEVSDAVRVSSLLAGQAQLEQLMSALPEHYRQAVVLRDVQQLPYQEVARRLDIEVGTVKSRVARGRALVAARLSSGTGSRTL